MPAKRTRQLMYQVMAAEMAMPEVAPKAKVRTKRPLPSCPWPHQKYVILTLPMTLAKT